MIKAKKYEEAFSLIANNNFRTSKLPLDLAEEVRKLGKRTLAERIFKTILLQKGSPYKNQALVGLLHLKFDLLKNAVQPQKDSLFLLIDQMMQKYHTNPQNLVFDLMYAEHLINQRDEFQKAETILKRILKKPKLSVPFQDKSNFQLGKIYLIENKLLLSESYFQKVSSIFKNGEKYVYLIVIALLQNKDANHYLDMLIKGKKGLKNGNINDALKILIEFQKYALNEDEKKAYAKAIYYYLTGVIEKSISQISRLIKLNSDYQLAGERFKFYIYMSQNMFGEAFKLAEKNYLNTNEKAEWLLRVIQTLIKRNHKEEARRKIETLILEYPNSFWTAEARRLLQDMDVI